METNVKQILKEPLLHFLLIGICLFIANSIAQQSESQPEPDEITITRGQIEHLIVGFTKTWQRPPSEPELSALIEDRIKEEVYYREAIALGLDRDDTVIRRRLRQKMEFISEDLSMMSEPSEEELLDFFQESSDKFLVEQGFTFNHVYLSPARRGDALEEEAEELGEQLVAAGPEANPEDYGDAFLVGNRFAEASLRDVTAQFGEGFAEMLADLPVGDWEGPIESGYGKHFVIVKERIEGRVPDFAEVRDNVRREWEYAHRVEVNEEIYNEMLERYTVVIEGSEL